MTASTSEVPAKDRIIAGKFLTFVLDGISYALGVAEVREIIRLPAITALPHMPGHIRGGVNLRGKIVPVADFRARFGLAPAEPSDNPCVIVAQVGPASGLPQFMGLVVDGVTEVVSIAEKDIGPAPDFGAGMDTRFILGMAKLGGIVTTLLDIDAALSLGPTARPATATPR